ncbi:cilia- and flagella-associated protein 91-like [Galleria mellonella]|uniref:Cilia- and flagella-associated protein 91 n=1 Tax=Galleria mellonella TaxID=7137 RepID=A0ABM3MTH6_GALME|nr:cilia- and flagella-associated protein 91-like [Galleria mellonella]
MSGETLCEAPRRHISKMRVHDYLYDSAFIVSGARDYARTAFKAAMASAQINLQPVYSTMFSEVPKCPRMRVVYHPNCRLPEHVDRSYGAYVERVRHARNVPTPQFTGKDRFKFSAVPKKLLAVPSATPDFHPPTPVYIPPATNKPRSRGTQSLYRESSAQTTPWQPDGKVAENCTTTPEVLYLDKLEWGPDAPYRTGDLPADFHTTEIINKLRHARSWGQLVEQGQYPRWMKRSDAVITDVETKDWIFREAEIDELQDIRLALLHQLQLQQRQTQSNRTSKKLAKLWTEKKQEMERKIENIRRTRDRELRKLSARGGGGQRSQALRTRTVQAAADPASPLYAPLARHGRQARTRHADIHYDPGLLSYEDHQKVAEPPEWLQRCGHDLKRSCSGHHLRRDAAQLCERETKWSEQFLENLHNDLKKARLGAATTTAGPLHVMKSRRPETSPRPATPSVEPVDDSDEVCHQAALMLQKIVRGRAVQNLMYEGRARASELTEELKTTHGLQKEDQIRIAREETKAREYNALRTEAEDKEAAISALVDELCGGAVAAALDFLEKELRRLKEERRQHAYILIALREKTMREAAEAGRRQKEEHRRREHDEMFKQILGVTQETVDAYFREIVSEGVLLAAEEEAVRRARADADRIDEAITGHGSMSTAEQNELVAELVQQFLLPEAHKAAARHRISALQKAKMEAARGSIFGLLDEAEAKEPVCTQCSATLDDQTRCTRCPSEQTPTETDSRDDPRWKHTRARPRSEPKSLEERYPAYHELRCMLNVLIDEAVQESRTRDTTRNEMLRDMERRARDDTEACIDAKDIVEAVVDRAVGSTSPSVRVADYHHLMMRVIGDALDRTEPFEYHGCPKELPSEIRRRAEEERTNLGEPTCHCEDEDEQATAVKFDLDIHRDEVAALLPSELTVLEEMRRCKCDTKPAPSAAGNIPGGSVTTEYSEMTEQTVEQTSPDDEYD